MLAPFQEKRRGVTNCRYKHEREVRTWARFHSAQPEKPKERGREGKRWGAAYRGSAPVSEITFAFAFPDFAKEGSGGSLFL